MANRFTRNITLAWEIPAEVEVAKLLRWEVAICESSLINPTQNDLLNLPEDESIKRGSISGGGTTSYTFPNVIIEEGKKYYGFVRTVYVSGASEWIVVLDGDGNPAPFPVTFDENNEADKLTMIISQTQVDSIKASAADAESDANIAKINAQTALKIATTPINIPYGGFEKYEDDSIVGAADKWARTDGWDPGATAEIVSDVKYTGSYSMKLTGVQGTEGGVKQSNIYAATNGHSYKIMARVRSNTETLAQAKIKLECYNTPDPANTTVDTLEYYMTPGANPVPVNFVED